MIITRELINKLKGYGLHLISIKDKKPNKPEFYNGSGDWSWKKDKDGNFKGIDFDAQHPYSDVQMPFAIIMDNLAKGKHTDQNSIGL